MDFGHKRTFAVSDLAARRVSCRQKGVQIVHLRIECFVDCLEHAWGQWSILVGLVSTIERGQHGRAQVVVVEVTLLILEVELGEKVGNTVIQVRMSPLIEASTAIN